MVQPSLRDAQPFLLPIRGLKSTATFIDRSAVTEESIIQIILQATGNKRSKMPGVLPMGRARLVE